MTVLSKTVIAKGFLSVLIAAAPLFAFAQTAHNVTQIDDLGVAHPSSAKNVSIHPDFHVYKWQMAGGGTTYQVNSAKGVVIGAFIYSSQNGVTPLAIGRNMISVPLNVSEKATSQAVTREAPGKCPCRTTITQNDENVVIYVTTDSEGNVINVTVIRKGLIK